MLKLLPSMGLFLIFSLVYFSFNLINYYQIKHIKPAFKDLALYNFYLLGAYWLINLVITFAFQYGASRLQHVWAVTLIYWSAAILPAFIMIYIMFKQMPTTNEWIGLGLIFAGIIFVTIK